APWRLRVDATRVAADGSPRRSQRRSPAIVGGGDAGVVGAARGAPGPPPGAGVESASSRPLRSLDRTASDAQGVTLMKHWLGLGSDAWTILKEAARHVLRHPVVGVAVAAQTAGGRWLLIRRRDTGDWALPGGTLEWGE